MLKTTALLLTLSITLSACGSVRDSNLNPFNWFGGSRSEPVQVTDSTNALIPESSGVFANRRTQATVYFGTPVDTITEVVVERVPGGAIIRAEGLGRVQGIYDVQLTPANDDEMAEDGVLTYRLEGIRPEVARLGGPVATREVTAARRVTDQTLAGVRTIRVEGLDNAQVTRRR